MKHEPIQIAEVGGIDVTRLSEQVSRACDVFFRKRGLWVEKSAFGRNYAGKNSAATSRKDRRVSP